MAPADPKKLLVPKLKKTKSEFDQRIFSYKEVVYALQYLYVKLFLPPPVGGVAFRLTGQHEHSKQAL